MPVLAITLIAATDRAAENIEATPAKEILTGADQTDVYLPLLKGKRIGMLVNQTSIIGDRLSVDSLLALGIQIKTIFGPEHGFRGNASNGAVVNDETDAKTGLKAISLLWKKTQTFHGRPGRDRGNGI